MHLESGLYARLSVVLLTALPLAAQVGLGLSPMRVEARVARGGSTSGALTLGNDVDAKVRVAAELLDFFVDSNATPQFERNVPSESEYSCRRWLMLNPMELELAANANQIIRYTIKVPADAAERSYHCAVGFTTRPTADQEGRMGLKTAVRVVAAFYVVVGDPRSDGHLRKMRLEYAPRRNQPGWRAVVAIENRGQLYLRPSGTLEVLSESGQVLESSEFIPLPALPGKEQNYVFPLKLQTPGRYTLRARVDVGSHEIQEGTAGVVAERPAP